MLSEKGHILNLTWKYIYISSKIHSYKNVLANDS